MKYAKVFIENSISKIGNLYTYKAEDSLDLKLGVRVVVPFGKGNRREIAVVVDIIEDIEDKSYEIKNIIEIIDFEPIINKDLIELGFWMSKKYLTQISKSFSPILPPGDIRKINRKIKILKQDLSIEEEKILKPVIENNYSLENLQKDENFKYKIRELIENKTIKLDFEILSIGGGKFQNFVKIKDDYINTISKNQLKLSDKQLAVMEYLSDKKEAKLSDILRELKISDSPIKTLESKGLLSIYKSRVERKTYDAVYKNKFHNLNMEQLQIYNSIIKDDPSVSLIHGLTGSGKTEIYLKLSKEITSKGGQVIVLLPEIGLTPQMIERFKGVFRDRVAVMHSKLSLGERYDSWQRIKNGDVDIVIGARSAVFAPFENLKMIIVDEEHDSSYRFHNALRYNAIDVAIKRMEILSGKVILGSATPDVCDYYLAKNNKFKLYELKKRAVEGAKLPNINIVDMRDELVKGNMSIFSSLLSQQIDEKLKNNEQIILFLNRRGFSNFVACRSCGHVIKCDNCDISMTYHRDMNILRCHYCGSTKNLVTICPQCGSKYIRQFGIGTQRVEEEVKKIFGNAQVLRMDRDTMSQKNSYDIIYEKMKNHEVDILVGTQMLAKGLDFDNVTLVGVIAADLSLFISDYRANETTFQLLTQVSGRSGRGKKEGEVVIQSYNPENYAVLFAKKSDYIGFYNKEIEYRRLFKYPPFVKMVNIYFISQKDKYLDNTAHKFLKDLENIIENIYIEHTRVISLPKIKRQHRNKLTIKVKPDELQILMDKIKEVMKLNEKIFEKHKIFIDIEFI
ncbi:primosomal protein N` [Peptoniphilus sp. ING2-D1G]|nr:primosomal protein N` [Peptoniphilus sp. ING2-D1G]